MQLLGARGARRGFAFSPSESLNGLPTEPLQPCGQLMDRIPGTKGISSTPKTAHLRSRLSWRPS